MGKVTTTRVTYVCDRCKAEHDESDYIKDSEWGQLNLEWRGDTGGRMHDGAAGGIVLTGKAWLCLPCTKAFLNFLSPTAAREV